jgi:hypothetical protein
MASGSIIGECPYCKRLIFEDNWTLDKYGELAHIMCDYKAMLIRARDDYKSKEIEGEPLSHRRG